VSTIVMVAAVAGFIGILPLGLWLMRRQHLRAQRALQQLERRGFRVDRAIVSEDERALVALDNTGRAAGCQLGRSGDVLVARIARLGTIEVSATEDGEPFDESLDDDPIVGSPISRGITGRLVLRLTFDRKVVELRFLDRVPVDSDSGKDWDDYDDARKMLVWWCATLRGKQPAASYRTPRALMLRSHGLAQDAALKEQIAEETGPELPKARVVTDLDSDR
jgi:hypothetical protein